MYRGLMPFLKDDPSYKEILDLGRSFGKLSEKEQNAPIQEENLFPQCEKGLLFK